MSGVKISSKNMQRVKISMKRLCMAKFGEDCFSEKKQKFTRDNLIEIYVKNIIFWKLHLPEITPKMSEFTNAKHAVCSNAIEQLWKTCEAYNITEDVKALIHSQ